MNVEYQKKHWSSINYDEFYHYGSNIVQKKVRRKVELIKNLCQLHKDDRILEIGCGTGAYSIELAKFIDSIHSIDCTPSMIKQAKKLRSHKNITYYVGDIHNWQGKYSVILGFNVLQYLRLDEAIPNIKNILHTKGAIGFIEPNAMNPLAFMLTKIPFIRKMFKRPNDARSFYGWEIKNKFREYGFNVKVDYIEFLPNFKICEKFYWINTLLEHSPFKYFAANLVITSV